MNYQINKSKIFLRLEEYELTIDSLSKLSKISVTYLINMLAGKTKKLLPFLTVAKILDLSLNEIIIYT